MSRKTATIIMGITVGAFVAALPALAQGPGRQGRLHHYNPATEVRETGTVEGVREVGRYRVWSGTHILLKTDKEDLDVHLAADHFWHAGSRAGRFHSNVGQRDGARRHRFSFVRRIPLRAKNTEGVNAFGPLGGDFARFGSEWLFFFCACAGGLTERVLGTSSGTSRHFGIAASKRCSAPSTVSPRGGRGTRNSIFRSTDSIVNPHNREKRLLIPVKAGSQRLMTDQPRDDLETLCEVWPWLITPDKSLLNWISRIRSTASPSCLHPDRGWLACALQRWKSAPKYSRGAEKGYDRKGPTHSTRHKISMSSAVRKSSRI